MKRTLPVPPEHWLIYRSRKDCRSAAEYWTRYALAEPHDFAYAAPRRVACRLFGRHNTTCRGRVDHPRR